VLDNRVTKRFHNLKLFDGRSPTLRPASIVIEGSQLASVDGNERDWPTTSDVESIDLGGRTVVPGLMNLHDHITWRRGSASFQERVIRRSMTELLVRGTGQALVSLMEGETTLRDCASKDGTAIVLRDAIRSGEIRGPRIFSVGSAIGMTGGHGTGAVVAADGVDEIRKAVRRQLHQGADWIKLMVSGGFLLAGIDQPSSQQFSFEEMQAAFEEAHRAGRPTTAHAHPAKAIQAAIEAGADCIEHAGLADQDTVELMAKRGTFVVPTVCYPRYELDVASRLGQTGWLIEMLKGHLDEQATIFGWLRTAGCKICAGTDGTGDLQYELRYFVELGMTPYEALRSATVTSAECLGVSDKLGTIEEGKWADFVVVEGDPLTDIGILRNVYLVVKEGELYWPQVLSTVMGENQASEYLPAYELYRPAERSLKI
jgi:imidazolonepropionase-like amidohydrolase